MTDRKTAIIELRDKVRAGGALFGDFLLLDEIFGSLDERGVDANRAYHGPLAAAYSLHEAVLPRWTCDLKIGADGNPSRAILRPLTPMSGNPSSVSEWADTPARAWLLSILEALIQMEDTQQ